MREFEQNPPSPPTNRSWFDRSPILPTGQKKIAYQAARLCLINADKARENKADKQVDDILPLLLF